MTWTRCTDALPELRPDELIIGRLSSGVVLVRDKWGRYWTAELYTWDDEDISNPPCWEQAGHDGYVYGLDKVTHWAAIEPPREGD